MGVDTGDNGGADQNLNLHDLIKANINDYIKVEVKDGKTHILVDRDGAEGNYVFAEIATLEDTEVDLITLLNNNQILY